MEKLKAEISEIKESQIRMEGDVKHHIKRTDALQKMVEPTYKAYIGLKWSIGAILTLGALAAAIAKLSGLF